MTTIAPIRSIRALERGGLRLPEPPTAPTAYRDALRAAKATAAEVWHAHGFKSAPARLITTDEGQPKLALNADPSAGLTLTPAIGSGLVNICPNATAECAAACTITTADDYRPTNVRSRNARTDLLINHPEAFAILLAHDIRLWMYRVQSPTGRYLFRPNVGSDVDWQTIAPWLYRIDGLHLYGYTKRPDLLGPDSVGSVAYSYSGRPGTWAKVAEPYLRIGGTVAVAFQGDELPATWSGWPVIDGDATDDRTSDPRGVIVGLRAKGKARRKATPTGPGHFIQSPDRPVTY